MSSSLAQSESPAGSELPSVREALAQADELEAAHQHLAAIELLTRVNRATPKIGLERRLVTLRQHAFSAADSSGLPEWPPLAGEPLGPVGSLPEIEPGELSAEVMRRGIIGNGAFVIRDLLDRDTVRRLTDGIDLALDAFQAWQPKVKGTAEQERYFKPARQVVDAGDGAGHHLIKERHFVRQTNSVWTADSPKMLFDVLGTFEQVGVLDAVEDYLGERPAASIKKLTLRVVPPDSPAQWHQDGAFLGEKIRSANLWVALSDCGIDAPGLDLIPRRLDDIVQTGTHGALFDWTVGPDLIDEVAGDTGVIRPVFSAGDAIMFDERFLHRTAADSTMTKPRYAIESWFFAPSAYAEEGLALLV